MGYMKRTQAAAAVALVGMAMFALVIMIHQIVDDDVIQSNDCITAFLRLDQEDREHVPDSEVERVCGSNPEFQIP
jgi:hypothetical protein